MIKVAFKTAHGTYLCAEPSGRVIADRAAVGAWELWEVHRIDENRAAFRSAHGKFLCAEEGGGRELVANRAAIGEWETFGYWIRENLGSLEAPNKLWVRVGDAEEGFGVTATAEKVAEWETFIREEIEVPDLVHPDPVVGRIRTHGNEYFKDDNGPKVFCVVHMGDLVPRWMYARDDNDRTKILSDLDDAAAAGYHIVRSWWHLDVDHWPWNEGGDPPYPGVSTFVTPDFVSKGVALADEVAKRGMRITIGAGGIGRMDSGAEEQMARTFNQVIREAGSWKFAWAEAVNEPSSGHATSDPNDPDEQPPNLTKLARIMVEGTDLMWHLGYWDNNNYQESGRFCVDGMSYNYVHGWRGGNTFNKIDRRGTWCRIFAHESGAGARGRLTIDGESVGWPTDGPPLRYVSATENRHEMNSHEALALIACATAVRGIPSHMSGTGVQRFEPFTNTVGWKHIPWLLRQLPKDVATFELFHGGMGDGRVIIEATTNGAGVLARADQAIADDGRFVAILYNQRANQHQSFRFRRSARFVVIDPESMTFSEHTVHAGQRLDLHMFWGKVLVGHVI